MGKFKALESKLGSLQQEVDTLTFKLKTVEDLLEKCGILRWTSRILDSEDEGLGQRQDINIVTLHHLYLQQSAATCLPQRVTVPGSIEGVRRPTSWQRVETEINNAAASCATPNGDKDQSILETGTQNSSNPEKVQDSSSKSFADPPSVNDQRGSSLKNPNVKEFKCKYCPKICTTKQLMVYHQTVHTGKLFTCPLCHHRAFNRRLSLQNHMKVHTKESLVQYHLKTHTNEILDNLKSGTKSSVDCELQLQIVGKKHDTSAGVQPVAPTSNDQIRIGKLQCKYCVKTLDQKTHTVTNGELPFTCNLCCRAFSQKASLASHMTIHMKDRPYSCEPCHRAFRPKTNLETYMPTHTEQTQGTLEFGTKSSDDSGTEFQTANEKQATTSTSSGLPNTNPTSNDPAGNSWTSKIRDRLCTCVMCSQTLGQKSTLQLHVLTYAKGKPTTNNYIACRRRRFRQKLGLTRQVLTHTMGKLYTCTHCDLGFASRSHLKRHKVKHLAGM